jgi:hypothetical protein
MISGSKKRGRPTPMAILGPNRGKLLKFGWYLLRKKTTPPKDETRNPIKLIKNI